MKNARDTIRLPVVGDIVMIMHAKTTLRQPGDMKPGDHACFLYSLDEERRKVLTDYLKTGLELGAQVILATEKNLISEAKEDLRQTGVDVEASLSTRSLILLDASRYYHAEAEDQLTDKITMAAEAARNTGFTALRIAGVCHTPAAIAPDAFFRYEQSLNALLSTQNLTILCLFDRRQAEPELLLQILSAHPLAVVDGEVIDNLYYLPSSTSGGQYSPDARLNNCLFRLSEMRKIRENIRETELRTRTILDSVSEMLIFYDLEKRVVWTNRAALKALGGNESELAGRYCHQIWHDLDNPCEECLQAASFLNHSCSEDEKTTRDGRLWLIRSYPVHDAAGVFCGVVQVGRDLTETRLTEEALRTSEKKHRSVVENATEGILVIQDGIVRYANPRALAFSGYSLEELTSKPWHEFIPEDDRAMAIEHYPDMGQGDRKPCSIDHRVVMRDGSVRWIEAKEVLVDWEGRPAALVLTNDITVRKLAEAELEKIVAKRTRALQEANRKLQKEIEERRSAEDSLKRSESMLEALDSAATGFLRASCLSEAGIQTVLAELGQTTGVSRIFVYAHEPGIVDSQVVSLRYQWQLPGTGFLPPSLDSRNLPWFSKIWGKWRDMLSDGRLVSGHFKDFPDEEQKFLAPWRIKSLVIAPIFVGGKWWGFIGFSESRKERTWSQVELDVLRAAATTMATLIARTRVEEALRESEERYRRLVDYTPLGLVILVEGRIVFLNSKALDISGFERKEDLLGRLAVDSLADKERVKAAERLSQLQKTQTELPPTEYCFVRPDGQEVTLEVSTMPIVYAGSPAVLSIGRDITIRRRTEKALKTSEEHLRSLMENAQEFVVYRLQYDETTPTKSKVVFVSPSVKNICGVSDALRHEAWFEHIHQDDAQRVWQAHLKGQETDKFNEEFRCFNPRLGEWRWLHCIATAIRDAEGRPAFANGIIMDITDRKRAEEALRESEARYRQILNHAPAGIFEVDFESRLFVSVNEVMSQYTGYRRQELFRMKPEDILTDEGRQAFSDKMKRLLSGEQTFETVECELTTKTGSLIWVSMIIRFIYEGERPTGAAVVVHDVTERKRAEEALRESEKKHRELIEGLNEALIRVSLPSGRLEFVGPAAEMVFGYNHIEMMESPAFFLKMIHPDYLEYLNKIWTEMLNGKVPPVYEYKVMDPEGRERWILQSNKGIYNEKGHIVALEAICRNVTDRKRAEEELLFYQQRLRRMGSELLLTEERERRKMAMDLHDDIGQTLAISNMKLKALRQTMSGSDLALAVDEVCQLVEQMISQTRSLTLQLSPPILHELGLEAALEWLTEQIQEKHGIEVFFEDDGSPRYLDGDVRVLLFRLVRELLMNVIKHARASWAKVFIRTEKRRLLVGVEDDGVGFAQPGGGFSKSSSLRGFGLFSIRERLDPVGGHLEIESKPGSGTRATLVVPLFGPGE